MSFDINTKANIPFKRLLGKAHTSNDRDPANEPEASWIVSAAQNIWAQKLHPTDPNDVSNSTCVAHGSGINGRVIFDLVPVSGTNASGKYSAYYIKVPATVPTELVGKINPRTGLEFASGDRIGNLIPETFGFAYIAKPFCGGVEVPPSDASDWFIDYAAGVLTQETDVTGSMKDYTLANSKLEAYVYVGLYVSDQLSQLGTGYTYHFYDFQTVGNGLTGSQDGVNKIFTLTEAPDSGSLYIHLNGILQFPGVNNDYVVTGSSLTFNHAPIASDVIVANYRVRD